MSDHGLVDVKKGRDESCKKRKGEWENGKMIRPEIGDESRKKRNLEFRGVEMDKRVEVANKRQLRGRTAICMFLFCLNCDENQCETDRVESGEWRVCA